MRRFKQLAVGTWAAVLILVIGGLISSAALRARIVQVAAGLGKPSPSPEEAIATALHHLIEHKLAVYLHRRNDWPQLGAFYQARGFAPLWVGPAGLRPTAREITNYLKGVAVDGLDPADYAIDTIGDDSEPFVLAQFELSLTSAVLDFARDADSGRIAYARVSADIDYRRTALKVSDILNAVSARPREALANYHPAFPGYQALRGRLADLKGANPPLPVVAIDDGPAFGPGIRDRRVVQLRRRFGVADWVDHEDVYTGLLVKSVRDFQTSAHLPANGIIDARTTAAMNAAPRPGEADVIVANMERWRWMPRDGGGASSGNGSGIQVVVNIPDFSLRVERNAVAIWTTRVIVGQRELPTPILSESMISLTVNPTWNVPQSIAQSDYLPALRRDPSIIAKLGINYEQRSDGTVKFYQLAGAANALGSIRFNFPNKYLVYQHDTPEKIMFDRSLRAISHGCVRVDEPLTYAEILLAAARPDAPANREALAAMLGGAERTIDFTQPVPVHLTYQTAFVDAQQHIQLRDDIYGYDTRTLALLAASHRHAIRKIVVPASLWHRLTVGARAALRRIESKLGITAAAIAPAIPPSETRLASVRPGPETR